MWEMWNRGSSPEGSVGSFTNTSLRKIGWKRQRPPNCKGSFLVGCAAEVGYLPSCTCGTAGAFSRRRLCPSPTTPAVWSPVKSHKRQDGLARHRDSKWEEAVLHLCQQQKVVEQEAVKLFAAFGFEQLPAVKKLPGTQTVGDRVKH